MKIFLLFIAVILSSCARPYVDTPKLSDSEIKAEQQIQIQQAAEYEMDKQEKKAIRKLKLLERLTSVAPKVTRAGIPICRQIHRYSTECVYEFVLKEERGMNAYTDGEKIFITPAMISFTKNNEELALILSHEYAHIVLGHVTSSKANAVVGAILGAVVDGAIAYNGYNTGQTFTNLGASAGVLVYSQAFESEADYVGLYIMENAGYDISKAPNFWRRMSERNPDSIVIAQTHPTTAERFLALNKTIEEISRKKSVGQPLSPNIRPQDKEITNF